MSAPNKYTWQKTIIYVCFPFQASDEDIGQILPLLSSKLREGGE